MSDQPSNPNEQPAAPDVHARLQDIVDDYFGVRPTTPIEGLLDIIENNLSRLLGVNRDSLQSKIVNCVADWIDRNAPIVRDQGDEAEIKLSLLNPGGDDDGTLVLEWRYRETVRGPRYDEQCEGRVEGVQFK